jgi:hypothetical protein
MPRVVVPTHDGRQIDAGTAWDYISIDHEIGSGYPQGSLQQYCPKWRNYALPWDLGTLEQGTHLTQSPEHESQDFGTRGKKIFGVDWRVDIKLTVFILEYVDYEEWVCGVWIDYCA